MKTKLAIAVFTSAMTLSGFAQFYVAGDFNGWSANGTLMTETSTGSGIWQATIADLGNSARHEFKITDGAWDGSDKPAANSWLYSDADGNVTITYDTNNHSDGWENSIGRIGVSLDPGTWTAVGDWQGWVNNDPATTMTSLGGGIYEFQQNIAPGTYQYKAVDTGSWDAIGSDARSINADNLSFTTTPGNSLAIFKVDALNGTIQVAVVPEPSSLVLFSAAGVTLFAFFRRRK